MSAEEEMSDWQPALILPLERCPLAEVSSRYAHLWPEGKVVRVKKVRATLALDEHHIFKYIIHPDDDWEPKGNGVCEFQIQTD